MTLEVEAILDFWFGGNGMTDHAVVDNRRWFAVCESTDKDIERRFGKLLGRAVAGRLDHWRTTARGTLALIILLDQFSRNMFRGTARAFAQDDMALRVATTAIANGLDRELNALERAFLYMPLQHAENMIVQDRSVVLYRALSLQARARFRKAAQDFVRHAEEHRAIVARFGRFPHRNAILGRETTPEEAAFLAADDRAYGQLAGQS